MTSGTHNGPEFGIPLEAVLQYASNRTRLSEPLVTELFTSIPRRLGKHINLHVARAQATLWSSAVGPKVLMRWLKTNKQTKNLSAGPVVIHAAECVPDRTKGAFLVEEQKTVVKLLKAQHRVKKLNLKE